MPTKRSSEADRRSLARESRPRGTRTVMVIGTASVAVQGLNRFAVASKEFEFIGEAPLRPGAALAIGQRHPDYILVGSNGLGDELGSLLRTLNAASAGSSLLVCTDERDGSAIDNTLRGPVASIVAWADATTQYLTQVMGMVHGGTVLLSPRIAATWHASLRRPAEVESVFEKLTAREVAVLQAMGAMKNQKDIGQVLNMAERTVDDVILSLKRKLRVENPFGLGAWAHAMGLVSLTRE